MRTSPIGLRILFVAVSLFIAPTLRAEPTLTPPRQAGAERAIVPVKFMRFVDDGHAGGKFETAVVTLRNKDGVIVRLVGAVHIGEKSYYQGLNKSFENDDAVLYELVKPKGGSIPQPGQKSDNMINQIQHLMKDVLNLDFQLDDIDYSKANFVHADMDAETFAKMQEDRGETFQALMLKQLMKAFKGGDEKDPQARGTGRLAKNHRRHDRNVHPPGHGTADQGRLRQATRQDGRQRPGPGQPQRVGHPDRTKQGRDEGAGKHDRQRAKQRSPFSMGAAHMPDMAKRVADMGFTPVSVEWNTAWDLTIRPDAPSGAERLLKELIHSFDDK